MTSKKRKRNNEQKGQLNIVIYYEFNSTEVERMTIESIPMDYRTALSSKPLQNDFIDKMKNSHVKKDTGHLPRSESLEEWLSDTEMWFLDESNAQDSKFFKMKSTSKK